MTLISDIKQQELPPAVDLRLDLDQVYLIHAALVDYWTMRLGLDDPYAQELLEQFAFIKNSLEDDYRNTQRA